MSSRMGVEDQIFSRRSKTFYPSSKIFAKSKQSDVTALYSFLRVADDYVDERPYQPRQLFALRDLWRQTSRDPNFNTTTANSDDLHTRLVKNIVHLTKKHSFENDWIESFFMSMQMDLNEREYFTLGESLEYVYGSGEVVGLMMAKIMELEGEALPFARLQGRAFQWINFVRDLSIDLRADRYYFPRQELCSLGLNEPTGLLDNSHSEILCEIVKREISRYRQWQTEAEKGYHFIPDQFLGALKMSVNRYNKVAETITRNLQESTLKICK